MICSLGFLIQQFVYPTLISILPRIVKKEEMTKANSIMTATYRILDLVFMEISGVIIAVLGAIAIYLLDAVAFLFLN